MATDIERWQRGDTVEIGDFRIVPKRDFPKKGFFDKGKWITHGWVVIGENNCNALPGATWGRTQDEAVALMNVYVAAGGTANFEDSLKQSPEVGKRFWSLLRALQYFSGAKDGE